MQPGQSPIDSIENPVQDLSLAKRLHAPGEPKEQVALEREGLEWPNVGQKKSRVAFWRRTRTVAVVIVFVVVLMFVLSVAMGLL